MPAPVLDIFNQDAFSAASLTGAVSLVPNTYGRIGELGIFKSEPVPTTSVMIVIENGVLNLLPTRPRGGPASLGTRGKQTPKSFPIPHIPHEDAVLATDVQNMLAAAPANMQLETVLGFTNRKLITMRRKHAITLEHLRVTALRGVIKDYDGSTLLNLFQAFGITQKEFDFQLGTDTTDIGAKCDEVTAYFEDNLMGETMTGVKALMSPEWATRFLGHKRMQNAFQNYPATPAGANPIRENVRKGFVFRGIEFEEYRGSASYIQEDGSLSTPERFIPAGDVRFFPLGTSDTFTNYWGPPDFWDAVNTAPGVEDAEVFVAPLERMKFGKGMEIHTESNPLPLVKRPQLLGRGYSSN